MESDVERCENCGAPHAVGIAKCAYCDVPIRGRATGVECPSCGELATADRRSCAACNASFMKTCIFCSHAAFVSAISCPGCREPFAGAEARKKAREEQAKQQQMMGIAAQGIAVLGQVAATPTGRNLLGQLVDAVIKSNDGKG